MRAQGAFDGRSPQDLIAIIKGDLLSRADGHHRRIEPHLEASLIVSLNGRWDHRGAMPDPSLNRRSLTPGHTTKPALISGPKAGKTDVLFGPDHERIGLGVEPDNVARFGSRDPQPAPLAHGVPMQPFVLAQAKAIYADNRPCP